MATILHDPSFVVIPFLQLEIGLNNRVFGNGIDIKNNVLQKNSIELCLDRQNYFNNQLGRYYDISLVDFRNTFYPYSNTPDYNLEENYNFILEKLKLSDISGEIVFVKDVSNNSSVGNVDKTSNILREVSEGFATALDVSGGNQLRTDSYMKLIKKFGLKNDFTNMSSTNHVKTKFTTLKLNEVALEMANEYDRLNTGNNLGTQTFHTSNTKWGVYNHYEDDKIFDDVAALFDTSGIAHTTSKDPYTINNILDTAIQKKTVYFCFSIIIHDLQEHHSVSTTTTTSNNITTTTTTADNESVAGPIQFLLYFRCSHNGTRILDDYLNPTAYNTNYATDHTFTDISSSGFKINWIATSNNHDRVVKFRDFQIGIPGSVISSTDFDPTVLDTIDNIYADVSANAWDSSDNDVSGVLLDLSHTAVGYNIDTWDISSSHTLSDLSSNTYFAVRTLSRIGNIRNDVEDISLALVTEGGQTKPHVREVKDASDNILYSDISTNPGFTLGDRIGFKVIKLDGNIAIKSIMATYHDLSGTKYSFTSNDSGLSQLGPLQTNPRISADYSFNQVVGGDYPLDISFVFHNIFDLSSAPYTFTITTGSKIFGESDISQNVDDTTCTTIFLNIKNITGAAVPVDKYYIDYSSNISPDLSSNSGNTLVDATNGASNFINTDVSVNNLEHANTLYDISCHLIKVGDTSSNTIMITAYTRPGMLRSQDVVQDLNLTEKNKIYLQINNLGNAPDISGGMYDISGYTMKFQDFSGNDASGNVVYDLSEQRVFADTSFNTTQNLPVTDQSATALDVPFLVSQANFAYDVSVNLWSNVIDLSSGNLIQELSGCYMKKTFYSRPELPEFVFNNGAPFHPHPDDKTGNASTDYPKIRFDVSHNNVKNGVDISGYTFINSGRDISNGAIIGTRDTYTETSIPVDVSASDMSGIVYDLSVSQVDPSNVYLQANVVYDLSVNVWNIADLSSVYFDVSGVTRPHNFRTIDISQNVSSSTKSSVFLNVNHDNSANTLDISGYTIDVSGTNGVNASTKTVLVSATNAACNSHNSDISVNDLSANTRYDLSVNLFNIHDLSNAIMDISTATRPSDFSANDISQNETDSSSNTLIIKIFNSQIAGTLDISGYEIDVSGNNGANASLQTIIKTATLKSPDATNNDVSLNDLSANTLYDLSVNLIGSILDISNAKFDISGVTRPSNFVANDISQNLNDVSASTVVMKIYNSQLSGTLDISGYNIDVSGNNGTNSSLQTIIKIPTNKGATDTNNDVSLNDLSANTTYDLSINIVGKYRDLSNAEFDISGTTRPTDFVENDISQNLNDVSASTVVMKIHNSQIAGTLDISGYEIDVSGNNGANASLQTIIKTATNKGATDTNNDVSLNDLSANTLYDLSVNLIGSVHDLSNAEFDISGVTRPSNFVDNDISQNLNDVSASTVVMKIHNSQGVGSLDISGYSIDISGNNGANASLQTIFHVPTDKGATATNNDVSLNDLSANTTYDLSINIVGKYRDLSNAEFDISGTTRPSDFVANDISQNLNDVSASTIVMKIHNSQIAGTLDISGYEIDVSGNNGVNASLQTIIKTATNKGATDTNNDVSLNDLSDNTLYDLSVNLIGSVHDLSNAEFDISGVTRPSDFATKDISQNICDTSSSTIVMKIDNSQGVGSLDISGYSIDISGNNGDNASLQTIFHVPTDKGATATNNDVSLNDLSANTVYDLSVNIVGKYLDLSNAELDVSGVTRPSDFATADVSQNLNDVSASTIVMKIHNSQGVGSLDISGYSIDISGTNGTNASLQTVFHVPTDKGPTATNNDVSLNDLSANTVYDLSVNIVGKYRDLSNAELDVSGVTRPSDFARADISQNITDTSSSTIVMKIDNSQGIGSLDISGYTIDISGNNGTNSSLQTIFHVPTDKGATATNNDVSLNDLSANTVYDLSVNIVGKYSDLSNAELDVSGVTRPSDFATTDVSQNLNDVSASTIVMKIHNSQIADTLDISGYSIDISGTNGTNASLQTVFHVPTDKGPTATNNDVSLNDLSANTVYDLSVNIVGKYRDLSNAELDVSGVTRPSDFATKDVSQNLTDTSSNALVMKIDNSQGVGSLDISGYSIDISGNNGANASLQTIFHVPTDKGATATNNDVSLNDLSANTLYDLSVNIVGKYSDLSNAELDVSGVTRPSDFATKDISQNLTDTSSSTIVIQIDNSQNATSLDISGYEIKYVGTFGNDTVYSGQAELRNTNQIYENGNIFPSVGNEAFFETGFSVGDTVIVGPYLNSEDQSVTLTTTISQINTRNALNWYMSLTDNLFSDGATTRTSQTIKLSKTVLNTGTIIKSAVIKTPNGTNNDVSLNDLSENTVYDLSVNLIGQYFDLSNAYLDLSGTTRPSDFATTDVSQNINDTSSNTLMLNVNNSQLSGTLDISGYTIDISGTNGVNASKQTIIITPTDKTADAINTDVSLNDMSANTYYDISINIVGKYHDLSNAILDLSGTTRPTDFLTNGTDVSQNFGTSFGDLSTNQIIMSIIHKDVSTSLDISGYIIEYSVDGSNNDTGKIIKTATNKGADSSNNDVSLNDLNHPNAVYDMSICLFNTNDMSNTYIDISGLTKPRDFSANDVSNNAPATTATLIVINVNNRQDANTVDISEIIITPETGSVIKKALTDSSSNAVNRDISFAASLLSGEPNNTVNFDVHLVNIYDMSNSKVTLSGINIRPSDFSNNDISQNITDTSSSTIVMKIDNSQLADTLDISGYTIDISGTNGVNASLQTIIKKPIDASCNAVNNDVSLNDLSANTLYDLSINLFNVNDVSNSEFDISGITRPSDFATKDVSQNITDTSSSTIVMKIDNSQGVGSLDISGYTIDVSGNNGANASLQTIIKIPTDKGATAINNDVSLNDLSANTVYDLSINIVGKYLDLSNAELDVSGVTRPSDFATKDISQNLNDVSASTIVMKIDNSQIAGTLDISGYSIDISGTNGANASLQTVFHVPTNKGPTATNNDVSLNDLSANTMYDLSINIVGYYRDLSNAELDVSGVTRPSDFATKDISQNITDTSSSTVVMKIDNSQGVGSLDISGYSIDISGNNGDNASLQTIFHVPTDKGATATNNDVSLNDLSANTVYDLSVNIVGKYLDLSNAELDVSGVTRPSDFATADVSQNLNDVSASTIVMKIHNSQIAGTLDISGYSIDISGTNGTNASLQTVFHVPTDKGPTATNNDVSLNDLSANTTYDLSINIVGYYRDLSNAELDISGTTRPSDFVASDVSQNIPDSSSNVIILNILNSQITGSLDISGYQIDYSGNNGTNSSKATIIKTAINKGPDSSNNDVSLNDLSANTMYDLSVNLIGSVHDLSNSYLDLSGTTAPTSFTDSDVSQNQGSDYSDNQVILSIQHKDVAGTLDMSAITILFSGDISGTEHTDTISKIPENVGPAAFNNDVSLNDLSGNMKYDLSVNLVNVNLVDGNKIGLSVYTKPVAITNANVSQNVADSSSNAIVFNWTKGQLQGTSDISGFIFDISGYKSDDSFYNGGTIYKSASNTDASGSLTDISINNLVANTRYDFSANQFNIYDMSQNDKLDISGTTKPTTPTTTDVSQNTSMYSTSEATLEINNNQPALSLDISGYYLKFNNGLSLSPPALTTSDKHAPFNTGTEGNDWPGKCSGVTYNFTANGHDGTGSYLAGSGNTTAQTCFNIGVSSGGNNDFSTTTKAISFWFKVPADSGASEKFPIIEIQGTDAFNEDRWAQLIIHNNLKIYGQDNNNINKLYINGSEKTLPSYSTGNGLTGTALSPAITHTTLRGWTHFYIEFGETLPSGGGQTLVFLRGYDSSAIGAPTDSGIDDIKIYDSLTLSPSEISQIGLGDPQNSGTETHINATNSGPTESNTITSIAFFSNCKYDCSFNILNVNDISSENLDFALLTKPLDIVSNDVSQNITDTTSTTLMMNVNLGQLQTTLDISKIVIDFSGNNGTNATTGTKNLTPSTATAHSVNTDVGLLDLAANTTYDLSAHLINIQDVSNNKIASTGTTRPSDFTAGNVSQTATYATDTILLTVANSQTAQTLDISGYNTTSKIVGTSDISSVIHTATNKGPTDSNTNVSIGDLSANYAYDISLSLFNTVNDISNSYIGITGFTNPSNFVSADVSQNIGTSTTTVAILKIDNSQISGSADISGYDIDISAGSGWVTNRTFDSATNTGATDTNSISIGSLAANTLYDVSVNMFNTHGRNNSKIQRQIHTTPANFGASDISQVLHNSGNDYANADTDSIKITITNPNVGTTIHDISGYLYEYSLQGANTDTGTGEHAAVNGGKNETNADLVIDNLNYPNGAYDISFQSVSSYITGNDLSGNKRMETMYTKPSDFVNADISQNVATTTTSAVGVFVNNSQDANTAAISKYVFQVTSSGHTPSYEITPSDTTSDGHSSVVVGTSPTLVSNKTYSLNYLYLRNEHDLSNSKLTSGSFTTLPVAPALSASSTANTTTTVNFDVANTNANGSLAISTYKITHSPDANETQPVSKTPANTAADATGVDTQLVDLSANRTYAITVKNVNSASMESAASSSRNETTLPLAPALSASSTASTTSSVNFDVNNNNENGSLAISGYKVTHNPTESVSQPVSKTPANTAADATGVDTQLTNLAANKTYTITCVNVGTGGDSASSSSTTATTLPAAPTLSDSSTANTTSTINVDVNNNNANGTLAITKNVVSYTPNGGSASTADKNSNGAADAANVDTQLTGLTANTQYSITATNVGVGGTSAASGARTEYTLPNAPSLSFNDVSGAETLTFTVNNNNPSGSMAIAKYTVYVGTSSNGTDIQNGTEFTPSQTAAHSTSSTIQLTGLSAGDTYYIKASQYAQSGLDSATSSEVSATTPTE